MKRMREKVEIFSLCSYAIKNVSKKGKKEPTI